MLAPLALGYIGGAAIGVGIAVAGHGLLAAFAAAWLSAIVLTVAIPAALLARPRRAPAAAPADLAAWQTDLGEELKSVPAAAPVACGTRAPPPIPLRSPPPGDAREAAGTDVDPEDVAHAAAGRQAPTAASGVPGPVRRRRRSRTRVSRTSSPVATAASARARS